MNNNKVILISIDGLRPDAFLTCGNPYIDDILRLSYHSLSVKTVMPSITLPCHMSLFHSVPPERHGISTNVYSPMVRPISGIFEQSKTFGKVNAFYYAWDPIRDVARPSSLHFSEYVDLNVETDTDATLTTHALERIAKSKPDFLFLYLGETDNAGHTFGWMSQPYLQTASKAIDCAKRVIEAYADEYTIIITADHGGHDRTHGLDIDADMVIPNFFIGKMFAPGTTFEKGSILDIAPTIAKIMDIPASPEWEGKPVF